MSEAAFRFTPDVLIRIRHHARRGLDAGEIGYLLDTSATTVLNICREHGIKVHLPERPIPREVTNRSGTGSALLISLARRADIALAREAEVRGVTPAELASQIVEIVARDGLWKAVLD